jgi:hypothetical protein
MQGNLKENPASGQILVGQADATYKPVTMSGDATIDDTGNVTVSGGGVSQIIAGTNVTIEPSGGTGAVTVNATGSGGGGSVTQIAQTVLDANTATITFSDIPDTFENLFLVLSGACSAFGFNDQVLMELNGDSTTNMSTVRTITDSAAATVTGEGSTGNALAILGTIPSTHLANQAGCVQAMIPGYKRTVFFKSVLSQSIGVSDGTNDMILENDGSLWNVTDAITTITLSLTASEFLAGTVATLYGYM